MKETYTAPEMEVVEVESEDIITTSNISSGGGGSAPDFGNGGVWW